MKTDVTHVPLAASLAAACPTCGAQPGAPCRYVHDLLKGKQVVHERGKRMRSVHNARAGAVKAQWQAEYRERQAAARQRLDAEMAALYASGKTLEQVAGLSPATVRKRAGNAGAVIRPRGSRQPGRGTVERDRRIGAAYTAGARVREIAGQEGVSCMTVYNALRRQGVQPRRAKTST